MRSVIVGDSNSLFIELDGFVNLAKPGFRVADALNQVKDTQDRETLIVGVGVNDTANILDLNSSNTLGPNIEDFRRDYTKLLELAKQKFSRVIALGLLPSTEQKAQLGTMEVQYFNETIVEFNKAIRELCESLDVEFVDLLPSFLSKEDELLMDHIHPNEEGKEIAQEKIRSKLEQP